MNKFKLPDPQEEERKIKRIEEAQEKKDLETAKAMAMSDEGSINRLFKGGYAKEQAADGQGQIIQQVNELQPFQYDEDGNIIGGHMPPDIFFGYWGFFAPTNSLTHIDENKHGVGLQDFKIARIARRWTIPRAKYDPLLNVSEDIAEHLYRMKSAQAIGGFERIMSATQRFETEQEYRLQNKPSALTSMYKKMAGRE